MTDQSTGTGDSGPPTLDRLVGAAIIPVAANFAFNMLNVILEDFEKSRAAKTFVEIELPASSFDVAVGCAFAIVGIYACSKGDRDERRLGILAFLLTLMIIIGNCIMILGEFGYSAHLAQVLLCDLVAFAGLVWAIERAG